MFIPTRNYFHINYVFCSRLYCFITFHSVFYFILISFHFISYWFILELCPAAQYTEQKTSSLHPIRHSHSLRWKNTRIPDSPAGCQDGLLVRVPRALVSTVRKATIHYMVCSNSNSFSFQQSTLLLNCGRTKLCGKTNISFKVIFFFFLVNKLSKAVSLRFVIIFKRDLSSFFLFLCVILKTPASQTF